MPLLPNSSTPIQTTPIAEDMLPIDVTLAVVDTAEDFATAPVGKKIMMVSLINEGPGTAYIRSNAATTTSPSQSAKVKEGEAYWDTGLAINTLSFIGGTGEQPHIRGVAWAGIP